MVRAGKQPTKPAGASLASPARKKFVIKKTNKTFSPRSPGGVARRSSFYLYACEHQRASPGGAVVGSATGNMMVMMLASDKTLNDAVKALANDFGLHEVVRWMETKKMFGMRMQTKKKIVVFCRELPGSLLRVASWENL